MARRFNRLTDDAVQTGTGIDWDGSYFVGEYPTDDSDGDRSWCLIFKPFADSVAGKILAAQAPWSSANNYAVRWGFLLEGASNAWDVKYYHMTTSETGGVHVDHEHTIDLNLANDQWHRLVVTRDVSLTEMKYFLISIAGAVLATGSWTYADAPNVPITSPAFADLERIQYGGLYEAPESNIAGSKGFQRVAFAVSGIWNRVLSESEAVAAATCQPPASGRIHHTRFEFADKSGIAGVPYSAQRDYSLEPGPNAYKDKWWEGEGLPYRSYSRSGDDLADESLNSWVSFPYKAAYNITGDLTLWGWMRPDMQGPASESLYLWAMGSNDKTTNYKQLYFLSVSRYGGGINYGHTNTAGTTYSQFIDLTLNADGSTWYFIALTRDVTTRTLKTYIGTPTTPVALANTRTYSSSFDPASFLTDQPLRAGSYFIETSNDWNVRNSGHGDIGPAGVANQVWSLADIEAAYADYANPTGGGSVMHLIPSLPDAGPENNEVDVGDSGTVNLAPLSLGVRRFKTPGEYLIGAPCAVKLIGYYGLRQSGRLDR